MKSLELIFFHKGLQTLAKDIFESTGDPKLNKKERDHFTIDDLKTPIGGATYP